MTGALLVGGASRRFGSPKALACLEGETLAERAHRTLAEACEHVIVVGKRDDGLELPFPVADDGSDVRAAVIGVAAALRHAADEIVVVLPTDMPTVTPAYLLELAAAVREGAPAAHAQAGPLPAALRRSLLPVLERRIAEGTYALRDAMRELGARVVPGNPVLLRNVNTRDDLARL
ncbi:MAG: molybdenum cofactor guanylyltransferase [Thermoleophilia bacterium]|nr:molybdenum cofactor guanylyltransferase [Thermoleophilia bacterium]